MLFCGPGSLIENIITFWLVPTVTTAILQCWVSSNVSRAGMEEILHFLFLILREKLNWDIGSPAEEIKMCVTSLFFSSMKKDLEKIRQEVCGFPWNLMFPLGTAALLHSLSTSWATFPQSIVIFAEQSLVLHRRWSILPRKMYFPAISSEALDIITPPYVSPSLCFPINNYSD